MGGDADGFPRYVAFKGDNGKYLGFCLDGECRGFLKFAYDDLSSPYVKHEVVCDPSDDSYVHIKCCYNNKFWRRHATNHWWIFAGADTLNTDQSSWSCTLFDPNFEGSNEVSLRSVQLNKFAARWSLGAENKLDSCLYAGDDKPDECGVLIYYDLESMYTLPKYVAFKGDNGKYLGFCTDREYRGFLKFGYHDLSSPYVKHEVVRDPTNDSYVHIKCCYNNKLWRRHATNQGWIFAGADTFNTDQSSWSCTLFDPNIVGANKVSLRSLQLNKFAARWRLGAENKLDSCLYAGEDKPDECGVMTFCSLEPIVTLPKYVAFKGDNGMYLSASMVESHEYLQFNTTDVGDEGVRHEVVPVGDGTVRLKCLKWKKFWRRTPNWIWADTVVYDPSNKDLIFQPILVDQQSVALRCLGNNWFCKRLTTEGKTNSCLNAGTGSLERSAILRVEEAALSRKVHSIIYHMDTAHIYDLEPLVLCKVTATNNSTQATTVPVGFTYIERKSTCWKVGLSLAIGVKMIFEREIPCIANTKVEISAQFTGTYEWGKTEETQTSITGTYPAPVDPGQTVEVTVKATQAKCDIKYSYVQEDLLTSGDTVKFHKDDGVFNGVNYMDVQFVTRYL